MICEAAPRVAQRAAGQVGRDWMGALARFRGDLRDRATSLAMRALALDVGSKTIGLALSDAGGQIASAWEVLERRGHAADAAEVVRRVGVEQVGVVVIGLPFELDGSEGHRARLTRRFVQVLRAALDPSIALEEWDERFSTAAAERTLLEADVSRRKRKQKVDALAAQFILQGWLDARSSAAGRREAGGEA